MEQKKQYESLHATLLTHRTNLGRLLVRQRTIASERTTILARIDGLQRSLDELAVEEQSAPTKIAELERMIGNCERKIKDAFLAPKLERLEELKRQIREMGGEA